MMNTITEIELLRSNQQSQLQPNGLMEVEKFKGCKKSKKGFKLLMQVAHRQVIFKIDGDPHDVFLLYRLMLIHALY